MALFIPNISAIVFFHFPLVSLRRRQYKLDRAEKVNSFKIYLLAGPRSGLIRLYSIGFNIKYLSWHFLSFLGREITMQRVKSWE